MLNPIPSSIIFNHPLASECIKTIEVIGKLDLPIFIYGKSFPDNHRIAQFIHTISPYATMPYSSYDGRAKCPMQMTMPRSGTLCIEYPEHLSALNIHTLHNLITNHRNLYRIIVIAHTSLFELMQYNNDLAPLVAPLSSAIIHPDPLLS